MASAHRHSQTCATNDPQPNGHDAKLWSVESGECTQTFTSMRKIDPSLRVDLEQPSESREPMTRPTLRTPSYEKTGAAVVSGPAAQGPLWCQDQRPQLKRGGVTQVCDSNVSGNTVVEKEFNSASPSFATTMTNDMMLMLILKIVILSCSQVGAVYITPCISSMLYPSKRSHPVSISMRMPSSKDRFQSV